MDVKTKASAWAVLLIAGAAVAMWVPESRAQSGTGKPVTMRGGEAPPPLPPSATLPLKLVDANETVEERAGIVKYKKVISCSGDGTTCPIRK
jgi:hypothetical protein